jgi:hypothetical protein
MLAANPFRCNCGGCGAPRWLTPWRGSRVLVATGGTPGGLPVTLLRQAQDTQRGRGGEVRWFATVCSTPSRLGGAAPRCACVRSSIMCMRRAPRRACSQRDGFAEWQAGQPPGSPRRPLACRVRATLLEAGAYSPVPAPPCLARGGHPIPKLGVRGSAQSALRRLSPPTPLGSASPAFMRLSCLRHSTPTVRVAHATVHMGTRPQRLCQLGRQRCQRPTFSGADANVKVWCLKVAVPNQPVV